MVASLAISIGTSYAAPTVLIPAWAIILFTGLPFSQLTALSLCINASHVAFAFIMSVVLGFSEQLRISNPIVPDAVVIQSPQPPVSTYPSNTLFK